MVEPERDRLATVFDAYREDPARQRAWSVANPGNRAIREELADAVLAELPADLGAGRVLDVGCGTGWWLERLIAAGIAPERVVGVDLLDARIAAARHRAPGAAALVADARVLPLRDESCAFVTLFTMLSGTRSEEDATRVLTEVRRVLVPGGAVAIWEPRIPTRNAHTRLIRLGEVQSGLGLPVSARSLTLAPPLARRLPGSYRWLARVPFLRTHRLLVARI